MGIIALFFVVFAAWRFLTLRSKGTPVILRRLPATGTHGWRHGLFRYHGDSLHYFMLRSIAPLADMLFERTHVVIKGHRDVTNREDSFLFGDKIVQFSHHGQDYELVCSPHAEMAFTAWVEAAPSSRMDKMNPKDLLRRIGKDNTQK
nr:DUF2550 domain-containing protein [Corynebacterium sp. sy017]